MSQKQKYMVLLLASSPPIACLSLITLIFSGALLMVPVEIVRELIGYAILLLFFVIVLSGSICSYVGVKKEKGVLRLVFALLFVFDVIVNIFILFNFLLFFMPLIIRVFP